MSNTHGSEAVPSASVPAALPAAFFRVRLHLSPQQEAHLWRWWALTCRADELAWLAVQGVLQQRRQPDAETLAGWVSASREYGTLPGGLVSPSPDRMVATPLLIKQQTGKQSGETACDVTYARLAKVVEQALTLIDPTCLPEEGRWGDTWLPRSVVSGAVRRMYGPLMRAQGLPEEVAYGTIPPVRSPLSRPSVVLTGLRADGDSALLLRDRRHSERLGAELFTLPPHWLDTVLSAQEDGRAVERAALGAYGPGALGLLDEAEGGCRDAGRRGKGRGRPAREGQRRAETPRNAITAGTAEHVDGRWVMWLRFGEPVRRLGAGSPPPQLSVVGADSGMRRFMAASDGEREVIIPRLTEALPPVGSGPEEEPTLPPDRFGRHLMALGDDLESRRAGFYRLRRYLLAAYRALAPYRRVAFEALMAGQPDAASAAPPVGLPQLPFPLYQDRTFMQVLVDWLAADCWSGVGRRSVAWSPRAGSSRRCPACLRRGVKGTLQRFPGRWVRCLSCGLRLDRDDAAALVHVQRAVSLGRALPHVWAELPADLQVTLRDVGWRAALGFRSGMRGPADELDWPRSALPEGLAWEDERGAQEEEPLPGEEQLEADDLTGEDLTGE